MNLWLVRHAQPLVAHGICYGALNVPADAQATQQAAEALALELPLQIAVRVSPLQRCVQLAQALQFLRPDLIFTHDARLQEMNFGVWEGVAWDQIPRAAIDDWTANFGEHRFGSSESANQVLQRVGEVWDAWRATQVCNAWITHAGVTRAVQLLSQGIRQVEQADQWPQRAPGFGAWEKVALPSQ